MPHYSAILSDLKVVVDRILRRFRLSKVEQRKHLYRYTEFGVFRSMAKIEKQKELADRGLDLWMMDAETMNDPLEGRFLIDRSNSASESPNSSLLYKLAEESRGYYTREPLLTFISSFSRNEDSLDLWRNYCGGHGVVFGILPHSDEKFYRVEYGETAADEILAELSWGLRPLFGESKKPSSKDLCSRAMGIIRPVLYLVKAEGHKSEREVRLIETREGWDEVELLPKGNASKDGARLYILKNRFFFREPNHFGKVIIGPLADKFEYLQGTQVFSKEVQYRLAKNGITDIEIAQSRHNLRF